MRRMRVIWLALFLCLPAMAGDNDLVLSGRVISDAEAPLARARVTLHPLDSTLNRLERQLSGVVVEPVAGTLSDNEGRFRLPVPSAGLWTLRVEANGFMPRIAPIKPLTEMMELGSIRLSPSETLTVRTVDRDGKALAGTTVYATTDRSRRFGGLGLMWSTPARIGVTGEDGSLTLLRGERERLRLVALRDDRAVTCRRGVLGSGATLKLLPATQRDVRITNAQGQPVIGALVALAEDPIPLGLTDENGLIRLTPPTSGKKLSVYSGGVELWSGEIPAAKGADTSAFAASLRELRTMAGRVIDAKTREPVVGAIIWDETNPLIAATSDSSGQFALQGPASHRLEIRAGAVGYLRPGVFEFPLTDDGRTGPTLALQPAATVSGRVIDANNAGIAGATVSLSEKQVGGMIRMRMGMPQDVPDGVTDDEGRFRIAAIDPDLNYDISARADGFAPVKQAVGDLRPHETVSGVTLTLDAGGTIRGTVVDEDGNAISGVELNAVESAPNHGFGGGAIRMGGEPPSPTESSTGLEGQFVVAGLAKGKYDLTAKRSGFAPHKTASIELENEDGVDVGQITMLPGESLEGLVFDSDGAPVEGAEVYVTEASPMSGLLAGMAFGEGGQADAVADPNGWFAVPDLSKDLRYTVIASRPGFVNAQLDGLTIPRTEPLELRLEPSSRVAGMVLDPSGEPIPGAQVNMLRMRSVEAGGMAMQVAFAQDTLSDASGVFAFEEQEPGKITLSGVATGFQEAKLAELVIPKGEDLDEIKIELDEGAILQGRVVTPDGRPAIGASVGKVSGGRSFGPRMGGDAPVDGDGYYRLEGLPPGELSIEAKHPDYPRVARDVDLKTGINAVNLAFAGGQEVSGRIVDTEGKPVPAASIQAVQIGQYWGNAETHSSHDGSFTLPGVQDGDYTLQANAEGYASARDQKISVAGQPVVGLEVVLDRGARIAGTVSGLDPKDYGRVTIRAMGPGFGFDGTGVDHDGRFRMDNVGPGNHELVGTLTDSARRATAQVHVEPEMQEIGTELVFDTGLTLTGWVRQADVPIAGATLSATSESEDRTGWSQTDANGFFSVDGLVPGSYELTIREFRSGLAHTETVEVSTSREIEIEIPSAAVRGTVVDASDRQPLAGVQLLLTATGETPRGFMPLHSATTDSNGRFELPAIADGSWELSAEKPGYSARQQPIQVQHDRSQESVRVSLEPTEGISLAVRMPAGSPPEEVRLAVLSGDAAIVSGSYSTGENGSVRVSTVPPGTWDVLMSAPGTATTSFRVQAPGPRVPVQLAAATRLTIEVPELTQTGQLATVRLTGSDGRSYRTLGWSGQPQSTWQMRGGSEILTVPPGNWTVQVESRDGKVWTGATTTTPASDATLRLGEDG